MRIINLFTKQIIILFNKSVLDLARVVKLLKSILLGENLVLANGLEVDSDDDIGPPPVNSPSPPNTIPPGDPQYNHKKPLKKDYESDGDDSVNSRWSYGSTPSPRIPDPDNPGKFINPEDSLPVELKKKPFKGRHYEPKTDDDLTDDDANYESMDLNDEHKVNPSRDPTKFKERIDLIAWGQAQIDMKNSLLKTRYMKGEHLTEKELERMETDIRYFGNKENKAISALDVMDQKNWGKKPEGPETPEEVKESIEGAKFHAYINSFFEKQEKRKNEFPEQEEPKRFKDNNMPIGDMLNPVDQDKKDLPKTENKQNEDFKDLEESKPESRSVFKNFISRSGGGGSEGASGSGLGPSSSPGPAPSNSSSSSFKEKISLFFCMVGSWVDTIADVISSMWF